MLPMYTISCAKSPGWKTKTDGFRRKREVGGDWSEGLKGTDGKWGGETEGGWGEEMDDTHGSGYSRLRRSSLSLSGWITQT